MRTFPESIYSRPMGRARPTYNKVSWLQVVRAQKRLAVQQRETTERMAHFTKTMELVDREGSSQSIESVT